LHILTSPNVDRYIRCSSNGGPPRSKKSVIRMWQLLRQYPIKKPAYSPTRRCWNCQTAAGPPPQDTWLLSSEKFLHDGAGHCPQAQALSSGSVLTFYTTVTTNWSDRDQGPCRGQFGIPRGHVMTRQASKGDTTVFANITVVATTCLRGSWTVTGKSVVGPRTGTKSGRTEEPHAKPLSALSRTSLSTTRRKWRHL
jgi:hypothetical protein